MAVLPLPQPPHEIWRESRADRDARREWVRRCFGDNEAAAFDTFQPAEEQASDADYVARRYG